MTEGVMYSGDFINGVKEGSGTMKVDADKYIGDFKNDAYNGHGIYSYSDGRIYKGPFKDGMEEGLGILT